MNKQPRSDQELNPRGELNVHSIFKSIQGEGPFVGEPAVFLRLHGCNLQCPLCDTDYTSKKELLPVDVLLERIRELSSPNKLVVITGGEPFLQNITPLAIALRGNDFTVQVETNGTLFLRGFPYTDVCVVCSPKTSEINLRVLDLVDAFKYVIEDGSVDEMTGLPTRVLGKDLPAPIAGPLYPMKGAVYIQPLDISQGLLPSIGAIKNNDNLQKAIEICEKFGYTLGIQLHKIIGKE